MPGTPETEARLPETIIAFDFGLRRIGVAGMPMHADGSPSEMQANVRAFIEQLARYALPVDTVDERYTSVEAEATLKNARAAGTRGRIRKEDVDAAAAVLIAERYLTSLQAARPRNG